MVSLKHSFQSAKADGTDNTLVKPSDWNAEHDFQLEGPGVVGKTDAGSGPAVLIPFTNLGLLPAGALIPYAGTVEPSGFLFPYGQVLARVDQPALFAAIGTTYNTGGETTAQFRLPDLRDVVPAGRGNMGGTNRGLLDNSKGLGGVQGAKDVTLDVTMMPNHAHGVNDPAHAHSISQGAGFTGNNSGLGGSGGGASLWQGYPAAGAVDAQYTGISIQAVGGGQPHPNVQPTTIVNWLIKT